MADVKWIKITTNMFDDEKIKLIEAMPDKDTILIIWVKLLVQAGKCNASGYLLLNQNFPYTDEMLSTVFNRPLNTIRMALEVFKQFGMIDFEDNSFYIANWEKHQNIDGMEKIREQTKKRVSEHRKNKKQLQQSNVTCNDTVTQDNAIELESRVRGKKEELEGERESEYKNDSKDSLTFLPHFYEQTIKNPIPIKFYNLCESYKDDGMEEAVIMQAIIKGAGKEVPHLFIEKILENWYQEKKLTIKDIETKQKEKEKKEETSNPFAKYRQEQGWT